jgi:hypothetical protein
VSPLFHRSHERVVHRFLGAIEVAEEPDQRRQDAARFRTVDAVDQLFDVQGDVSIQYHLLSGPA